MKKIPYGQADYKNIKEENFYYVDKTKFIEKLENLNERFLIFLRPRRFGKSLFIAMLEAYYDKHYQDDFNMLFGDTYIGKHTTKLANKYLIMRFDFSGIDVNDVENDFRYYLQLTLNSFVKKYELKLKLENNNPISMFKTIFEYINDNKLELMILIDEYDNFANKLLLREKIQYLDLVSEKTASFKQFFTVLKTATSGNDSPLKRMFITGVTPMTMFDVTSGFNIGSNISMRPDLNDMIGFNEDELDDILNYYKLDVDKEILKEWYNNYKFNFRSEAIYNTDMILYFINKYQINNEIPEEMIDINVRSDYSKLRNIIYTNKKLNGNFETLQTLIAGDTVSVPNLVQDFSALNLEQSENFKSLMFYLGLITIEKRELD
ncbi:MAG: AAA family ATPase, partial [Campylobacterales bacterium]